MQAREGGGRAGTVTCATKPNFIFLQWGPSFMELTCHRLQGPSYGPVQTPSVIDEKIEFQSSEGGTCSSASPFGYSAPGLSRIITSPPSPSALKLPQMQEAVKVCHR